MEVVEDINNITALNFRVTKYQVLGGHAFKAYGEMEV